MPNINIIDFNKCKSRPRHRSTVSNSLFYVHGGGSTGSDCYYDVWLVPADVPAGMCRRISGCEYSGYPSFSDAANAPDAKQRASLSCREFVRQVVRVHVLHNLTGVGGFRVSTRPGNLIHRSSVLSQ